VHEVPGRGRSGGAGPGKRADPDQRRVQWRGRRAPGQAPHDRVRLAGVDPHDLGPVVEVPHPRGRRDQGEALKVKGYLTETTPHVHHVHPLLAQGEGREVGPLVSAHRGRRGVVRDRGVEVHEGCSLSVSGACYPRPGHQRDVVAHPAQLHDVSGFGRIHRAGEDAVDHSLRRARETRPFRLDDISGRLRSLSKIRVRVIPGTSTETPTRPPVSAADSKYRFCDNPSTPNFATGYGVSSFHPAP
jgi:hypothetical protein